MNVSFAYLLGMIIGNGTIQRGANDTTVMIELPHKNFITDNRDARLCTSASLNDIRNYLEPVVSSSMTTTQSQSVSRISFTKNNKDFLISEINRYLSNCSNHENMRIHEELFNQSKDVRIAIMQGIADSTAYVRKSNRFFKPYEHRVYIEVPHNWYLVIDVCNFLKKLDIPVQTIDWAHPNMRDSRLVQYNKGNTNFWKKEHQIKIWVNEFLPIGFKVIHKQQALEELALEYKIFVEDEGKILEEKTHKYYWDMREIRKNKPNHPSVNDEFIPEEIRDKQFSRWQDIARELGYSEES